MFKGTHRMPSFCRIPSPGRSRQGSLWQNCLIQEVFGHIFQWLVSILLYLFERMTSSNVSSVKNSIKIHINWRHQTQGRSYFNCTYYYMPCPEQTFKLVRKHLKLCQFRSWTTCGCRIFITIINWCKLLANQTELS